MWMAAVNFWRITSQVNWLDLGVGGHPALSLHSSDEPGELSQWLWTWRYVTVLLLLLLLYRRATTCRMPSLCVRTTRFSCRRCTTSVSSESTSLTTAGSTTLTSSSVTMTTTTTCEVRTVHPRPHLPLPFHLPFPSLFPFLSGGVLAWLSVHSAVQTCIWPSWCHCHSLSLASVKSRLVLPYWYQLTRRIVPDKGPLSGCCCCFVVLSLSCPAVLFPILLTLLSFSFPPTLPYHFFPSPSLPFPPFAFLCFSWVQGSHRD